MLENLEPVQDVKWYFLSAPWLSLHWHSLVVGLEALRIIRFDQVLFPWSVFPGSKKMIAEANVPHVVMKYITCVGISYVILLRRSPRSHPSLCCVPPRSSARLPSEQARPQAWSFEAAAAIEIWFAFVTVFSQDLSAPDLALML